MVNITKKTLSDLVFLVTKQVTKPLLFKHLEQTLHTWSKITLVKLFSDLSDFLLNK